MRKYKKGRTLFFRSITRYIHSRYRKKKARNYNLKNETSVPIDEHSQTVRKIDSIVKNLENTDGKITLHHSPDHTNIISNASPPRINSSSSGQMNTMNGEESHHYTGPMASSDTMNQSCFLHEEEGKIDETNGHSYPEQTESSVVLMEKQKPTSKKKQRKWLYTGIVGFDDLLEKGIPTRSNVIVAGGPGCGKTIFCLQTIYNLAANGDDCVFLSMEERPDRLKEHMLEFGFQIEEIKRNEEQIILQANGKGRISLKRIQPIRLARSIEALLEKASGTLPVDIDLVLDFIPDDFDTTLLTLDSISAIETAFSGTKRQYRIYIEQLFRYFEELELTTFMITESSEAPKRFSTTGVEEFLADGIIVFYNFQGVKERTRGAEIFKLRGASHSQKIVPIKITTDGIVVSSDQSPRDTLIG